MKQLAVISTVYSIEPVAVCISSFNVDRFIILVEKEMDEKKINTLDLIKEMFGNTLEIDEIETSLYDIYQVADDVVTKIDEVQENYEIILNVSGSRKPQALGSIYAGYARADFINKIIYITEETNSIITLPTLKFALSTPKRRILELIKQKKSITKISEMVGSTKGMIYSHIRELKTKGLLNEENELTIAGKLVLL